MQIYERCYINHMVLCSIALCKMKYLRQLLKVDCAAILLPQAVRCKGLLESLLVANEVALPTLYRSS